MEPAFKDHTYTLMVSTMGSELMTAAEKEQIIFSMIVPAYNEGQNIRPFYERVCKVFSGFTGTYEIIFIDDGSKDNTFSEIVKIAEADNRSCEIQAVSFSRNFGKEAALYAGLEHARGQFQGFIDSDLQQQPEVMRDMLELLESNDEYDCIAAYQENRKDSLFINWLSSKFYGFLSKSSDMPVIANASDFRVFRRNVGEALLRMPETNRFSKGLFAWIGFQVMPYPYTPDERLSGKTSWGFKKLVKYALDGLFSFTVKPLQVATGLGGVVSIAAIVYLIVVVVQTLAFGANVPGYPTLVALILLFGGLQLFFLGVIGEYLGRAYIQGKHRPIYISRQEIDTATSRFQK